MKRKYYKILDMLYKFLEFNKYTILGDSIEIYKVDVYETLQKMSMLLKFK